MSAKLRENDGMATQKKGVEKMARPKKIVRYASRVTPIGRIFAAATSDGITDISINGGKKDFLKRLKEKGMAPVEDRACLEKVFRELDAYLSGRPVRFSAALDLCGTPFELSVWKSLRKIPRGRTLCYGDVARLLKKPGAARAVGNACGKNPVPIIIPCHRVTKGDGGIGGYTGGAGIKKALLDMEKKK